MLSVLLDNNLTARLRRAVANQGLTRYPQAKKDLEVVLAKEPNNKQALVCYPWAFFTGAVLLIQHHFELIFNFV